MAKNTICLWYDKDAEAAARFYAETFPDSAVGAVHRAPSDYPSGKEGDVITVEFTVAGVPCLGLNGDCEFDRYHVALLAGRVITGCAMDDAHRAFGKGLSVDAAAASASLSYQRQIVFFATAYPLLPLRISCPTWRKRVKKSTTSRGEFRSRSVQASGWGSA